MLLWVKLSAALAIVSAAYFAVDRYTTMAEELKDAKKESELLRGSLAAVDSAYADYVSSLETQIEAARAASVKLSAEYSKARDEAYETLKVFETHDLEKLIKDTPDIIEQRINGASARMFSDIEKASGR